MKNYKIQTISLLSAFLLSTTSAHAAPDSEDMVNYYNAEYYTTHNPYEDERIVTYDSENGVLTFTLPNPEDGQSHILRLMEYGAGLYDSNVKKLVIGEGFTSMAVDSYFDLTGLESIVIPNSMEGSLSNRYGKLFNIPATAKVYCEDTSDGRCNSLLSDYGSRVQAYTKDENGVYDLGGTYYASLDNMTASAPSSCADMATCLASIGTHCNSAEECQTLLDMSSEGTNCNSLSSCKTYLAEHPSAGNKTDSALIEKYNGTPLLYGKKIYTIQEAEDALSDGTKFHVGLTYK